MEINPLKNFLLYKNILLNFQSTINELKQKDYGWVDILVNVLLMSIFYALFVLFQPISIFSILLLITSFIFYTILFFIGLVISAGVYKFVAGLLGGKKEVKFVNFAYILSTLAAPILILLAVFSLLAELIPFLAIVFFLLILLLPLLGLFYLTKTIKEVFELSTLKAVAVWILPAIIAGIIGFILSILLFGALAAAVLSSLAAARA